jgi:hypothetical protein
VARFHSCTPNAKPLAGLTEGCRTMGYEVRPPDRQDRA